MKLHIASVFPLLALCLSCSSESRNSTVDTAVLSLDSVSHPALDSGIAPAVNQPATASAASRPDAGPPSAIARRPGQNIAVDIHVISVAERADTVRIGYQLKNLVSSAESLVTFHVDAPGSILRIPRPGSGREWVSMSAYRGRPMASWISGSTIPPGGISPELYFESVGVPGIVTYWAQGNHEPPSEEEAGSTASGNPLTDEMISGKTVGVDSWPRDRSYSSLIARLRALTVSTCNAPLLWITNASLCNELLADIRDADNNGSKQPTQAKRALDNYMSVLGGVDAPAPGVTNAAYWLLRSNAEIIRAAL